MTLTENRKAVPFHILKEKNMAEANRTKYLRIALLAVGIIAPTGTLSDQTATSVVFTSTSNTTFQGSASATITATAATSAQMPCGYAAFSTLHPA